MTRYSDNFDKEYLERKEQKPNTLETWRELHNMGYGTAAICLNSSDLEHLQNGGVITTSILGEYCSFIFFESG